VRNVILLKNKGVTGASRVRRRMKVEKGLKGFQAFGC